ncbi:MAG TPA: Xaa-Pro peptidase family protein [Methylomirabilota bacterium]|jgi:Xaa-Pro aminopeptidase
MYPHQAERLALAQEAAGVAALVATTPENVRYVTGFAASTSPDSRVLAVVAAEKTALVIPEREPGGDGTADAVIRYPRGDWKAASAALARALASVTTASGTIGVDEGDLSPMDWRILTEPLGHGRVVPAAARFGAARAVKGPYELDRLARALAIAEEALNAVLQGLAAGVTEGEAAAVFAREVAQRGGTPAHVEVTVGERTALPAARAGDRALRAGELIRFDVGCLLDGYHGAVTRTAVLGEPDERQARMSEALYAGQEAAVRALAPRVTPAHVFGVTMVGVRTSGLPAYQRHHVGGGIGLDRDETPTLAPGRHPEIEAGMVLRLQTPYYEPGWGGISGDTTVLVAESEARVLNRSHRGLVVLD